jgi:hypothetical protein
MAEVKRILMGMVAWVIAITGLHAWLNVDWASALNRYLPEDQRKINIAYIPVT